MQKLHVQLYFGIILMLSVVSSCVPEPVGVNVVDNDGALTIKFRAVFDSVPVIMGDDEQQFVHNGDTISFTDFRFFVSNVGLENQTNKDLTSVVDDDEVWQFNMPENETAAKVGDVKTSLTQPGEYKGIRLDFGVPAELNTSVFDPNTFGSTSPLADSDNFSSEFRSYKFLELKGEIVKNKIPFSYKIGQEDFYCKSKKLFGKSIVLTADANDISFDFKVDLKKVLEGVKISEELNLRESLLPTLGRQIMNNFTENSIELE